MAPRVWIKRLTIKRTVTGREFSVGGDREALLFRLDQRSIKLSDRVATLSRDLAVLPQDDPDRLMLETRLRTKVIEVDGAMCIYSRLPSAVIDVFF
jgi:small conductance mechanosensitive channel